MAVLVTAQPEALRNIVRRAVLRSGKRLKRQRKRASELKWSNASQRIRRAVLSGLAEADVEIFKSLNLYPDNSKGRASDRRHTAKLCYPRL
jgi:hypothetical protein